MYTFSRFLLLVVLLLNFQLQAQKKIQLNSPNKNVVFSFELSDKLMIYSLSYKGQAIIENSPLNMVFDNGVFGKNLRLSKPIIKDTTEVYELFVGKTKHVQAHYKELILPLSETMAPFRRINIVVRAFDDGLAFRYEFPKQANWTNITLLDENTSFNLQGNPTAHTLFLPNYNSSHEGDYTTITLNEIKQDTLMEMPTLFEFKQKVFLAITEASLLDYAGMYLSKKNGILTGVLSPLPKQAGVKVKAILPHKSPWRVLMVSDRIGELIESNILTSLSEPCRINDLSWLKPGKTTFPWWNGNVVPDTLNAPGNNFITAQYYIDFCARNNIQYHSVVEYGLHQWYTDDGVGFQPGPNADVTKPVPGLDMKQICDYAKSKGVGVRVWVQWAALYPKLEEAFAIFEKWGLSGMMVDFMDRDDQEMVNIQTEILEKAAKHHLHIQFHGAYKPTGLNRTYPNEFNREGTKNYEVDKWDNKGVSPDHDIDIPFTRMLAGSTDYHLGGFRAATKKTYRQQYTKPLVLGTRCHMLGMYVVLENYLQMVCDFPDAYEGQPGFEFIKKIPTTWDETKVLDAQLNKYIVIARKNGNSWYVGAINNTEARELPISFGFLNDGKYKAEIYTDANDIDTNPNSLSKITKMISNTDLLTLKIASGGGFVIHLEKE